MNSTERIGLPRQSPPPAVNGHDCCRKVKSERRILVSYEALPEYMKDNQFIRNYYRCEWPLTDIVLSVFSLHNETFNIWTHLVGFLIFTRMTVISLTGKISISNVMGTFFGNGSDGLLPSNMMNQSIASGSFFMDSYMGNAARLSNLGTSGDLDAIPLWPWLVFLFGAMTCLIFSSVSHLFGCHSPRFHYFLWRLDYTGISIMIICSFFAPIYYIFAEYPHWRCFYLSSVTLVGILVVTTLLSPSLSRGFSHSSRATLFLCMGFSGVIPAAHAVIIHWEQSEILMSLVYEILMGILYGVGAGIYIARVPERWKPGAFDIVGHSHQIFHIFVVAAALVHSAACLIIMDWRRALLLQRF